MELEGFEGRYETLDWDIATAMYGEDKTSGMYQFQRQLERAIDRERLLMKRKKKEALEFIQLAKEGHSIAIEWLQAEYSLHVFTESEIRAIEPFPTPPEPSRKPMLNFGGKSHE